MILPAGHRVLVRQENYEETDEVFRSARSAGLVISKDPNVRYQESVDTGIVVRVGPTAWQTPELGNRPWAAVGDKVVFAKHSGKKVEDPQDKEAHYVLINDEDVCALVKE